MTIAAGRRIALAVLIAALLAFTFYVAMRASAPHAVAGFYYHGSPVA